MNAQDRMRATRWLERTSLRLVNVARRAPWLRGVALSPIVARPGYWFATLGGIVWGGILSGGRLSLRGEVILAPHCPRWSFGRGGTTIGAVYLTCDTISPGVLEHEAVHRAQWKHYGLAFIVLYLAAGQDARSNRFEIEAGLERGGYR